MYDNIFFKEHAAFLVYLKKRLCITKQIIYRNICTISCIYIPHFRAHILKEYLVYIDVNNKTLFAYLHNPLSNL